MISDVLLVLLSHLLLHVSSVLGSGWSHAHELGLTQELDPRRLHPKSHATLSDRNNNKRKTTSEANAVSWRCGINRLFTNTQKLRTKHVGCKCCHLVPSRVHISFLVQCSVYPLHD